MIAIEIVKKIVCLLRYEEKQEEEEEEEEEEAGRTRGSKHTNERTLANAKQT